MCSRLFGRVFLGICLLGISAWGHAQSYPLKPVRVVIGYPVGAGNDVIGRLVLAEVSKALGQQFVVDNRPGATGNIGAEIVARSTADGYTLLNAPGSISMAYSLFPNLTYDLLKDLQPVAVTASVPFILAVHPSLPAKSVRELIALATSRPGELTFATSGPGGGPHLTAEMFKMRTGLNLLHVPYRGTAQANTDVVGGQVTMIFSPTPSVMPHVLSKRVRALAITSTQRHVSLPDVPTMIEAALPDFESRNWIALFAPAGTPRGIIHRLNSEINRIVQEPTMQQRLARLGAEPMSGTPEEWVAYVRAEVDKWAKVIKAAGVRLE
jgi:tripartite-type tricarboxylate transporter receptor subunit TctC